ncbi:M20 metallopeptidase family protein [Pseudostreptobacillus hongkongensis]|uniref:M20 metallopeptidase family protein n=1 Tax=Pseudostreptobacillus hongkongensis TaxID=1162717 RepID=UPI00082C60A5|nr:M20 family metallopeptidase [Pseudostreptobacillus hongkongensis]
MENQFITEEVEKIYDEVVNYRRYLHENPELSEKEYNTSKYIENYLNDLGVSYKKVADTGIYAYIKNGEGKNLAFRADMDALPIIEESGVDFSSKNTGVMHACGHDVHTSVQMGLVKLLVNNKDKWKGNVKFFFQPAEETVGGAKRMLEDGVNDDFKADALFGFHVAPEIECGKIGIKYGKLHASSATFTLTIKGKSSHAALAYLGIDAIVIGAKVVEYLQTIISRRVDARECALITVGTFNAGSAVNIVADKAILSGTIRTLDKNLRSYIINEIKEKLPLFVESLGASIDVDIKESYIPVINNDDKTKFLENNILDLFGKEGLEVITHSRMDAEDVGYFLEEIPGSYYRLGIKNEEINAIYDLHHPKFKVDERAIKYGLMMQFKNALEFLK